MISNLHARPSRVHGTDTRRLREDSLRAPLRECSLRTSGRWPPWCWGELCVGHVGLWWKSGRECVGSRVHTFVAPRVLNRTACFAFHPPTLHYFAGFINLVLISLGNHYLVLPRPLVSFPPVVISVLLGPSSLSSLCSSQSACSRHRLADNRVRWESWLL